MIDTPTMDYGGLSPIIALTAGLVIVLLAGLVSPRGNRWLSSFLTLAVLGTTAGLLIWRLGEPEIDLVSGALRMDGLAITISLMTLFAAAFAVVLPSVVVFKSMLANALLPVSVIAAGVAFVMSTVRALPERTCVVFGSANRL